MKMERLTNGDVSESVSDELQNLEFGVWSIRIFPMRKMKVAQPCCRAYSVTPMHRIRFQAAQRTMSCHPASALTSFVMFHSKRNVAMLAIERMQGGTMWLT